MTDGVEKLFNAVAVLCDLTVVLGAGSDAEGSGVFGDAARVCGDGGEASCCKVEVVKGGAAVRFLSARLTLVTVNS